MPTSAEVPQAAVVVPVGQDTVVNNAAIRHDAVQPVVAKKMPTSAEVPQAAVVVPVGHDTVVDNAAIRHDAVQPVVAKEMPTSAEVPQAAVAVSVSHNSVVGNGIAAPSPALPAAPATEHDHALAAQKSAAEAQYHLEQAKAAFKKTKTNVKEAMETGKKIQSTAGDIGELYEPPPAAQVPLKFGKDTQEDSQRGWLSRVILQIALCHILSSHC